MALLRRVGVGDFQIGPEERDAILEVLDSNRITEGRRVLEFESRFSRYIGKRFSVLVNSGTSALVTGLNALRYCRDVGGASKVITTPLTYIATINGIKHAGLEPVFVDVEISDFNITPEKIREHIEAVDDVADYSVILPVHLMGFPVDMLSVNRIADEQGLITFEDAAQAHGSLLDGRKCGSFGLVSIFSFYIAHNIQVGEMGAVVTDDDEIMKFARRFKANGRMCDCAVCTRSQGTCPNIGRLEEGRDPRFYHIHTGYNFKTSDIFAAIGVVQLKKADEIMRKRYENVKKLNEGLEGFSDLIQLPRLSEDISYLAYPILIKKPEIMSRMKLTRTLEENGIETRPLFSCIPTQQPAYSVMMQNYEGKLPNAEYVGENGFYIGCHQYLDEGDLNYIIDIFTKVLKQ